MPRLLEQACHRILDPLRGLRRPGLVVPAPEPGKQHLSGHDHRIGIRDIAPGDIRGGAVGRLRHRLPLADAQAGSEPQPAHQARADVGEDVAELVGGDDHVVLLRRHHQLHRDGVYHRLFEFHVRVFARHLAAFLGEHAAGEPVDRLLVRGGHLLSRSRTRDLEGFARDAARALARDHPGRDRDLVVRPEFRRAGDYRFGVEHPFGELAHEHDVHILVDRSQTGVGARGPHRGEELELLPDRRHHPGGIATRIGGVPDRPHHPAVQLPQGFLGYRRERVAVLLVPALADRQRQPVDGEARARGRRPHHLDALRDNFEADVVTEQDSDLQRAPEDDVTRPPPA